VAGSTLSPITKEKQQLKYADIEEADAILLIGDQLEASFPILYQRLYGYHAKGIVGVISSTEDRISHNAHKRIALPHGEFTVNFNEEVKAFFSGVNKPLMVVNSKGMPEGCLRAIMALAKEVGVDCRIPATAGNELGLQLLELPQATPGADHKILILGTVAEEAIPAGAKELFYLGGTPLENQGIFINHEGRASIVTALTEETTLLEKLQELAEATGAKAVTLEALKEELYQKHTFLKGDYSPVTEGFIVH
jgi:NADH dehydrogenase/NADH:ubiquinone oxidoreductase subunit G